MTDGINQAWRDSEEAIKKRNARIPEPTMDSLLKEKQEFLDSFKRIVESEDAKDMYDIALYICDKYNIKVNTNL